MVVVVAAVIIVALIIAVIVTVVNNVTGTVILGEGFETNENTYVFSPFTYEMRFFLIHHIPTPK